MLMVEQGPGPSRKPSPSTGQGYLLLVPVLDVEEEEGAGHDHAEDGEGRQDAVQRKGDLSQLFQDDGLVLGWLRPCNVKEKLSEPGAVILPRTFGLCVLRVWPNTTPVPHTRPVDPLGERL